MSRTKSLLIFIAVLVITPLVTWLVLSSLLNPHIPTTKVSVEIIPKNCPVTINGSSAHSGLNNVSPGDVTVEAACDGFKSSGQSILATAGNTSYVGIALTSNSPATASWYANHPKDAKIAEGISSKNFDESSDQTTKQQPLINQLPFISAGNYFRIDYGGSTTSSSGISNIPVIITAATTAQQTAALAWIKNTGFDVSDYKIKFVSREP